VKIFISLSAIPLSIARKYVKGFDRTRYANIFNKYGSGKGRDKYRIYIPIDTKKPLLDKEVIVPVEILTFLKEKKMVVDNYLVGTALLPDGKRTVRIGRLLAKEPWLKKIFDNDPGRKGIAADELLVVISRHPYDIAGMSFDRGWTSCMNLEKGGNKKYVPSIIKAGVLVAYLVKNDDKNINAPIARVLLKPYRKAGDTILVPSLEYGGAPNSFRQVVDKFCSWANSGSPQGNYRLAGGTYNEEDETFAFHYAGDENIPARHRRAAAGNKDIPSTLLAKLAGDSNSNVRAAVALNANTPAQALAQLADDPTVYVRGAVAGNPNTPTSVLARLAEDPSNSVRLYVAGNPNTST